MNFPNVFQAQGAQDLVDRIEKLNVDSKAQWGKMNVSQMLAHCNVTYDMAFTDKYPRPNFLMRILLKLVVKNAVCGPNPYPKNGKTAPAFIITGDRNFDDEKRLLVNHIKQCVTLGPSHFDGKESLSFGKMTVDEWNTQFYKHLDHHLTQFAV